MEKKQNSFGNYVSGDVKPLVMHEFITENDGLIFTYEDVKRAESEGYSKGFTEGLELGISQGELKALRENDIFIKEIIVQIDSSLREIVNSETAFFENFFPSITKTCLTVLNKLMPHFFVKHGKDEMENFLQEVVGSLIIQVPIQIKVSDQNYESILERLQELCATYPETIEIVASPNLADNACEIEWAGGGAKWNLETRYQEIELKLQEHLKA